MSSRRKDLPAGRPRGGQRPRKARYLVVTNGEVTESQYFHGLEAELGNAVISVRSFRADPSALADKAKDLKAKEDAASSGRGVDGFRGVFVVTDVDQFTAEQFQEARRTFKDYKMGLIISNPCFEVWLVDHIMRCPDSFTMAQDVERKGGRARHHRRQPQQAR